MARKNGSRVSQVLDRAAAAAIRAAAVYLSKLSDEELAEVERQLDIAYLYTKRDMSHEEWKNTAHYSVPSHAFVLAVLVATGERRRRRLMEHARALEQVGA